jgi:hypothetical protein
MPRGTAPQLWPSGRRISVCTIPTHNNNKDTSGGAYPHDLYLGEQELPLLAGEGVLRVGGSGDRELPSTATGLLLIQLDPLDVPVVDPV